ncbi:hypothetical protein OnM2_094024 [Erysiphe neolycopersici]|uniref:Uncharacterized protein n=1 Tax=Erysiphe neolycopersici TaxID=212602 RepID=A0A420HBJ4_9PEZI|nr:hypothetical protein OnM2_094024 [Erysiphe neolycopersici]
MPRFILSNEHKDTIPMFEFLAFNWVERLQGRLGFSSALSFFYIDVKNVNEHTN